MADDVSVTSVDHDPWSQAYDAIVPTNARAFIRGVLGRTEPIDETFFKPAEIDALRTAASRGLEDAKKPYAPAVPPGFTTLTPENIGDLRQWNADHPSDKYRDYKNPHIAYHDYDNPWNMGNRPQNIFQWFRDPSTIAQSTIGAANLETLPSGEIMLRDKYDFDSGRRVPNDLWGRLHSMGEKIIPPGKGYDVNVNLGHPDTWKVTPVDRNPFTAQAPEPEAPSDGVEP